MKLNCSEVLYSAAHCNELIDYLASGLYVDEFEGSPIECIECYPTLNSLAFSKTEINKGTYLLSEDSKYLYLTFINNGEEISTHHLTYIIPKYVKEELIATLKGEW